MADAHEAWSTVVAQSTAAQSTADIDLLLDRHEETIRSLPLGEAHSHHRQRTLAEIEAEISDLLRLRGPIPRAMVLHAEMAVELRKWPVAVRRWSKLAERSVGHRALAHVRTATAFRNAGNIAAAQSALRSAEKAGIDPHDPDYAAERSALDKVNGMHLSVQTIQRSLDAMRHGDEEAAVSLFRSGMHQKGTDVATIDLVEPVFRKLVQLGRGEAASPSRPHNPVPDVVDPAPVLLSCGFGFSGSGAVSDYLSEFATVSLPFGTAELACFDWEYGAKSVLRAANGNGGSIEDALTDFILVRVLGVPKQSHSVKAKQKVENYSLLKYFHQSPKELERLVTACNDAIVAICSAPAGPSKPTPAVHALRTLFAHVFHAKSEDGRAILLNNAIKGQSIGLLKLVPNSRAVVVVRDPRDQYVSRFVEGQPQDAEDFISKTRTRLKNSREALRDGEIARCADVVRFEDFVLSADVRHALRDRLGLSEADRSGQRFFFPEQSARNVGVHRDHPDQKDIGRIQEELAPYMIEPTL